MRHALTAASLALALAPAGSFAAAPAQVPQGCSKGTPGFFIGTLLAHTPKKLVIWVRGAYKEDGGDVSPSLSIGRSPTVSWARTQRSS